MKPVTAITFEEYAGIQKLRVGRWGTPAFLVRRVVQGNYETNLWMLEEKEAVALTQCGSVQNYWRVGKKEFLVQALRTEKDKKDAETGPLSVLYYFAPGAAAEWRKVLRLQANITELLPLSGGRFLLVAEYDPARPLGRDGMAEPPAAGTQRGGADETCEVITELPVWENGGGFTARRRTRLYVWSGGRLTSLSDEKTDVSQLRVSPEGTQMYYVANSHTRCMGLNDRLKCIDLATLRGRDVSCGENFSHTAYLPLPQGRVLVYGSDRSKAVNANGIFYRLEIKEGILQKVLLNDERAYNAGCSVITDVASFGGGAWQYKEGDVYWISTLGMDAHVMRINPENGEIAQVTNKTGAVLEFVWSGDKLYYTALRGQRGVEIYCRGKSGREARLTRLNKKAEKQYRLAEPQPVTCVKEEGPSVEGRVLKPAGWQEEKRYPAILCIHGGPKMAYGDVLFHEMQYLANEGFGVLYCNPAGSEGRGNDFGNIRGRWGSIDYEGLLCFLDEALAQNQWIDPERLGICGGSYGGYMVNWMIGHTTRFKAAVSERGISNWVTMALTTDIGYFFAPDETGSNLWEAPGEIWRQSPLAYAPAISTPTLFIHSDEDYRCRLEESLQMYTALQLQGVPTRMCLFKGENHDLSRQGKPANRARRLREISLWFKKYL